MYTTLDDTYGYDMTNSLTTNLLTSTTTPIKILTKHRHRPTKIKKPPTLHSYEKMVYSPERQRHTLYWRGYDNYEGKKKKIYELYPNQLHRVIIKKDNPNLKELETYYEKDESGRYKEYTDLQKDIKESARYFDIERQTDIIVKSRTIRKET